MITAATGVTMISAAACARVVVSTTAIGKMTGKVAEVNECEW